MSGEAYADFLSDLFDHVTDVGYARVDGNGPMRAYYEFRPDSEIKWGGYQQEKVQEKVTTLVAKHGGRLLP